MVRQRLPRAFDFAIDNSLLLIIGAAVALVWANLDPASYGAAAHTLHFAVNDIGMVFFFGLATKEIIESTLPGGALHSPRRAALPVLAAIGGMIGPALCYVAFITLGHYPELARGWAIPCATDIAFSYLVARFVFGESHPAIPFLLLLAIADDALGLVILAVFYPSAAIRPLTCALLMGVAFAAAWILRRRNTHSMWPYLALPGLLSWVGLYAGGFHPALALVPVLPFLPRAARDAGMFVDVETARDTLNEFEHRWRVPVEFILFFFALVNAGVAVTSAGAGTWVVLASILFGKPAGIGLATAVGVAGGLKIAAGLSPRDVVVAGVTAGIGFTVALFFATAAFPPGRLLDEVKLGALLSLSAAVFAPAAAWLLGAGRFASARPDAGAGVPGA